MSNNSKEQLFNGLTDAESFDPNSFHGRIVVYKEVLASLQRLQSSFNSNLRNQQAILVAQKCRASMENDEAFDALKSLVGDTIIELDNHYEPKPRLERLKRIIHVADKNDDVSTNDFADALKRAEEKKMLDKEQKIEVVLVDDMAHVISTAEFHQMFIALFPHLSLTGAVIIADGTGKSLFDLQKKVLKALPHTGLNQFQAYSAKKMFGVVNVLVITKQGYLSGWNEDDRMDGSRVESIVLTKIDESFAR